MANQRNGYDLSRNWFNFCFENPEKISPNHTAIYFFAIEHCNRLGWKEKFGFPTQMAMDAIGIKKHQTYIKYFYDLVDWGFFKLVQRAKNQYSSNIITLVSAVPKNGKALDKAIIKHMAKQTESTWQSTGQSKDSILKQETIEQQTNKQEEEKKINFKNKIDIPKNPETDFEKLLVWMDKNTPTVLKLEKQLTKEQFDNLLKTYGKQLIVDTLFSMENKKDLLKKYKSVGLTLNNWMKPK